MSVTARHRGMRHAAFSRHLASVQRFIAIKHGAAFNPPPPYVRPYDTQQAIENEHELRIYILVLYQVVRICYCRLRTTVGVLPGFV